MSLIFEMSSNKSINYSKTIILKKLIVIFYKLRFSDTIQFWFVSPSVGSQSTGQFSTKSYQIWYKGSLGSKEDPKRNP